MQNYSFVVDEENKPLAPTKVNKAWFLIRKGRAELVSKYPMVIRLKRKIENSVGEFVMGIDDGSAHVGMAIVQKGKTKNKVVFKATMEQRQDVKKKSVRRTLMIRKPKIIKEMAAPQAKTEVKNLFNYMKDTISIQNYVTLKNPFPATVILKNPVSINVTFNLMMSFTVSEKDKNFHANSLIESAFIRCWTSVKRTYPEVDIRIRGANVFISTDEYEILENCIKDFVKLWKPQEFALIKKLSK